MNPTSYLIARIDANGCTELPFVKDATQTYFNYLNGSSGYVVFVLGGGLLLLAMASRKQLSKVPGWLAGVVIAALALGALPALLPAFGVELGCGGDDGSAPTEQPAEQPQVTTPPAEEG